MCSYNSRWRKSGQCADVYYHIDSSTASGLQSVLTIEHRDTNSRGFPSFGQLCNLGHNQFLLEVDLEATEGWTPPIAKHAENDHETAHEANSVDKRGDDTISPTILFNGKPIICLSTYRPAVWLKTFHEWLAWIVDDGTVVTGCTVSLQRTTQ